MVVSVTPYRLAVSDLLGAKINYLTDTIKVLLEAPGSTYVPDYDVDHFKDVIAFTEATGTAYSAGGVALAGKSVTYTEADDWATVWAATTAYVVGQIAHPLVPNAHAYRVIAAGTTGGSAPTWPTNAGGTVVDGTVTWEEIGGGLTVVTATSPTWASSTISAKAAIYYDDTPASNKPLIARVDFGGTVSTTNGVFTLTIDPTLGILYVPTQ